MFVSLCHVLSCLGPVPCLPCNLLHLLSLFTVLMKFILSVIYDLCTEEEHLLFFSFLVL